MLSVLYWSMAGDTSESMEKAVRMVENASDSPERDGLMALIYYGGWGVAVDNEKAFFHAERGMRMNDGASCYVLGLMCANGDTPDQREGGRRQVYDHYDAERFMEMAAETDSPWAVKAHLWLGAYFMDSCRGEDPEEGIEHYKAAAGCRSSEAAEFLSDYYRRLAENENFENELLNHEWSFYRNLANGADFNDEA